MAEDFTSFSDALPPQNLEAEESILGGILLDPEAMGRVADLLKPEAFYDSTHRILYQGALALHRQGKPTDLMTVTSWLQDQGVLEKVGGMAKLAQLVDRTVSAVNIDRYALLIMEKYVRRQLIGVSYEIAELGYDTTLELEQVLDRSEQKVFNLTQERPQEGLVHISESLIEAFTTIENQQDNTAMPGLSCGFYDLDAMTSGFQRSDLIIIAARPSMGKTAMALGIAANIAKSHQLPVAIFSLEMSKEQLSQRLLASEAGVESNRIRSGHLTTMEMEKIAVAIGTLSELPIYIDDSVSLTVMQMRSQVRRLQAEQKGKIGAVLIDYLQLMEGGSDNRVQELSKITRSLKGLAREVNAPVLALSQLSRGVESRTNKRPMMSDLRESGCLAGDTLIPMVTGELVPIRELVGRQGFQIWALDESNLKLVAAPVSRSFCTGVKPVFALKTRLGRCIQATANHKFRTITGWVRLDQLRVGDRIALPRTLPEPIEYNNSTILKPTELALLGHLIGDGCTLPRHTIQYTTKEKDLAEIVVELVKTTFGDLISPRICAERTWYQVYLPASYPLTHGVYNPIAEWLKNLGVFALRSYEKFVPRSIFQQSAHDISVFLKHLWSTDGCLNLKIGKSQRLVAYYSTSSYQLACDVQFLLLRLSINAIIKVVPQKNKGRTQYHVVITGKPEIDAFIKKIGTVGKRRSEMAQKIQDFLGSVVANTNRDVIPREVWQHHILPSLDRSNFTHRNFQNALGQQYCGHQLYKQNISRERMGRIAAVLEDPALQHLQTSDLYWDEVVEIVPCGETDVYDLTVPEHHNFVANNIVVHNSIEQDADVILMLYRDAYYNPDSPDRNVAEAIIVKHRNGPTGTVRLLFQPELTKFENLARE